MPKLKTKKKVADFREGITQILESHFINLEPAVLDPLLDDLETFFNETFKPNNKSPYFSHLVKQYMLIFVDLVGEKPTFNPIMGDKLHKLSKVLESRYIEKEIQAGRNPIWDLETCLRVHEEYYRYLYAKLPFMQKNFTPKMMYDRFNENLSEMKVIRDREKQAEEDYKKKMEKLTQ